MTRPADSNRPPVFIIGNPRSGTTLLRLLISSHSKIVIPPECAFIIWLRPQFADWSRHSLESPAELERFLSSLADCRKFETWCLDTDSIRAVIRDRQPVDYPALCECVFRAFAIRFKPEFHRWGDKNNYHIERVAEINRLFPQAQFVHIVRDVRDVACSYQALRDLKTSSEYAPRLPDEIEEIGRVWQANIRSVLSDFASLEADRQLTIKYEDLVQNPEKTLQATCNFLNETFEPEMFEFYQHDLEPASTMDWKKKTRLPIDSNSVGKYRQLLKDREIDFLTHSCSELLNHFDYQV